MSNPISFIVWSTVNPISFIVVSTVFNSSQSHVLIKNQLNPEINSDLVPLII